MCANREGERGQLPISPKVPIIQAKQTIGTLIDAIIELVTNADDSYRRLESMGKTPSGKIEVTVKRKKGGELELLKVLDEAEGMNLDKLEQIIVYGVSTSGFVEGQSVRGMFGRGLKEAILALGKGTVSSRRDGSESSVRIWLEDGHPNWEILKDSRKTNEPNGTTVEVICSTGAGFKCPMHEKLAEQMSRHFALRDICGNKSREVILIVENQGGRRGRGAGRSTEQTRVRFEAPSYLRHDEKTVRIPDLEECTVKIFETKEPLDSGHHDPFSLSGWVVKTEGAILDRSTFGFEGSEAARYFYGEVFCPAIAQKIREGKTELISATRDGLNWKHPFCQKLHEEIRKVLTPYVERKRKELEGKNTSASPPQEVQKRIKKVLKLLNIWAREEMENPPETNGEGDGSIDSSTPVTSLTIKPEKAKARPKNPRTFSVYLPKALAQQNNPPCVQIELQDVVGKVWLREKSVQLKPHNQHADLFVGYFQVTGDSEGNRAYIIARWENSEDIAEFEVGEPDKRSRGNRPYPRTGGTFKDLKFESSENPEQRVFYDRSSGVIWVYTKFPPLESYLGLSGENARTPQGSVLLAEIVCEAFCRAIARKNLEQNPVPSGSEIDWYNRRIFDLMRKCSKAIHQALVER